MASGCPCSPWILFILLVRTFPESISIIVIVIIIFCFCFLFLHGLWELGSSKSFLIQLRVASDWTTQAMFLMPLVLRSLCCAPKYILAGAEISYSLSQERRDRSWHYSISVSNKSSFGLQQNSSWSWKPHT